MSTLVVHLKSEAQEKAVKAVLEALQINFEQEMDETEYLMSSPAMVARIEQSEKDILPGRDLQSRPLNEGFLILLTPGFSQVDILADCFVGAIHESPLQVCVRNLKLIGKRSLLFNLWN